MQPASSQPADALSASSDTSVRMSLPVASFGFVGHRSISWPNDSATSPSTIFASFASTPTGFRSRNNTSAFADDDDDDDDEGDDVMRASARGSTRALCH